MSHPLCIGCGGKTVAEIKDLGSYNEHKVPVWFCQSCNLSTPTMRQDRHDWTCYFCGFSDMVVEQDGDLWADMYSGWAQLK